LERRRISIETLRNVLDQADAELDRQRGSGHSERGRWRPLKCYD
jgi:hypothetical protein